MELDTPWDDPDPLVCNARHWYDVMSLITRAFDPERVPVDLRVRWSPASRRSRRST